MHRYRYRYRDISGNVRLLMFAQFSRKEKTMAENFQYIEKGKENTLFHGRHSITVRSI